MVKWYTRHADMTGATTAYVAMTLDTRNNTVTAPKIAQGYEHIKYIVADTGVDAAHTVDVGNIFVLKLSGDAMVHGDQEIIIGGVSSQETATSVTELVGYKEPFVFPTNIWVKGGQTLDMNVAYFGTDIGSPIVGVSLGLERGRSGTPLQYRTRGDSATQATDIYAALETKPDGSTGGFEAPTGVRSINRMLVLAVLNANSATSIGGNNWVFEIAGDAISETAQEICGYNTFFEAGGGTVTATSIIYQNPAVLPVELGLKGGNSMTVGAAYKGTALGAAFVAATLELVGGQAVG